MKRNIYKKNTQNKNAVYMYIELHSSPLRYRNYLHKVNRRQHVKKTVI